MSGHAPLGRGPEALEGAQGDQVLRDVLESLPCPVYVQDRSGAYVACNRAMEAHLGLGREAILGRRAADLMPQAEARFFQAQDEALLRAGGRQVFQAEVRDREGAPRHFLHSRVLWIGPDGGVAGIIGQCQDITDLHENEAAHRENEARLKAALDGLQEREAQFRALFMAGDGIKLLLAPEGGWILDANPAAEAFLGYDLATLRTMSISQFSGLGEAELSESIERTIRMQGAEYERRYHVATGEVRDVEVHAAPVEIKGKTYLWATLHDITEGKRAEEALRHASRQESLGRLAGNIANDFNNILQAAWTSLDLAEASLQDPAKVREALAFARGSLVKARRITQFIHQYSGQGERRPVRVDLAVCAAEFAAAATLPSPALRLEMSAAADLPTVVLDPDQLVQCLKAVVANAVEALGESTGTIRILVRRPVRYNAFNGVWIIRPRPGEAVELVVENDGPPIPREELPRIFDPYYTTKEEGRGLGLSSVLGIVRAHQAGLWAESRPDSGVRIHFLWPTEGASEARGSAKPGGPGALLVVDDEESVRNVLSRALAEWVRREVLVAAGGEEAVAIVKARKGSVGAVIVDANMPGMDGTAAFQAMRALQPGLPGILVSGCDEAEGRELARAYGFSTFIKKPFEAEALREAVEAALAGAGLA